MTSTLSVRTHDGRILRVVDGGDPDGWPLVVHHGTPDCGTLYPPHERYARDQGIRLIGYDRPGYGRSDRSPGRRVASAARDVATIADHLHIARFAVWGHSGGGPHALASAAILPDRVATAAASGSVAPLGAEGLDWLAGMGEANVREFRAALEGREALERFVGPEWEAVRQQPEEVSPEIRSLLSPEDSQLLAGELGEHLRISTSFALEKSAAGWIDDDLAFVTEWGFDPASVRVSTSVWHGKLDRFVPFSHALWLARRVPRSELLLFDHETHLTLLDRKFSDIARWLQVHGRNL